MRESIVITMVALNEHWLGFIPPIASEVEEVYRLENQSLTDLASVLSAL